MPSAPAEPHAFAPALDEPLPTPVRTRRARTWPGTARAWLLLCLLSVSFGAALAYFVYGPAMWIEGLRGTGSAAATRSHRGAPTSHKATSAPKPVASPAIVEPEPAVAEPPMQDAPISASPAARKKPNAQKPKLTNASAAPNVASAPSDARVAVAPAPPALPPELTVTPAIEPAPVSSAPGTASAAPVARTEPGSRLSRARACLAKGDSACAIALLQAGASTEAELELWIETLRAEGRALDAHRQMKRYIETYPTGRRTQAYRRILMN